MSRTASPARTRSLRRAGLLAAGVAAVLNTLVRLVGEATPAGWEVDQAGSVMPVLVVLPAAFVLLRPAGRR